MDLKDIQIKELIPADYNPRYISDDAFEQLKKSLKDFDAVEPIVINTHKGRENIIIGGHMRIKAAKALGWDTFPCVEVDLPLKRERELNVKLNKTTGEFDFDKLANFFDADELTEWGFSDEELFGDEDEEEQELTDLSDQLEASLRIEIGVESENEQQKLYKELTERGYECRILTL
jgi:ParB-like chromosome segregation protein Spo0J